MKNIYSLITLFFILFLAGCSKDAFKTYEKRIVGTWNITDIDRHGTGSDPSVLPFREGQFTFNSDGSLIYVKSGVTYQGTWNIDEKTLGENNYTTLQITAINFPNQTVLGEYYDEIYFSGSDHLKAWIYDGRHSYMTHFRR